MSNTLGFAGYSTNMNHTAANRAAPRSPESSFEALEGRVFLNADLNPGTALVQWGEGQVLARQGSYLISFDSQLGTAQAELMAREVATRLGVDLQGVRSIARGYYATINTDTPISRELAQTIANDLPSVLSITPDRVYQTQRVPNDPRLTDQYGLINTGQLINGVVGTANADISADLAWDITIGSETVIVAVIDTGVDYTHPDLAANMWRNPGETPGDGIDNDGNGFIDDVFGFDFGELDGDPIDVEGHGTQVASVIAAVGNNGIGVTGVAWNSKIMALKIADAFGNLAESAIVSAHDYATMMRNRGTNVVASNNSYRAFAPVDLAEGEVFAGERDAIERFIASGGTFVASAGNDSADNDLPARAFPASFNIPGVISVASTDNNDAISGFSSFGAETVDLAAPGTNILMAQVGGGYGFANGTSFSGPMVAGAVALLKSFKPNASAVEIREALINSADPLPSLQGKMRSGGRLNVFRALQIINIDGPVLRAVNPGPVTGQFDSSSGQPRRSVTVTLSKDIDPSLLTSSAATLVGDGADGQFGTGDDVTVPVSSIARSTTDPRTLTINLNTAGFILQRLPADTYRLTLNNNLIKDTFGRFLNGNSASGVNEVYDFRVIAVTANNEPNDAIGEATPLAFSSTGEALITGQFIGNGTFPTRDVDIYSITMPRGGLITAEVIAKRLQSPSTLDSHLRLFNAAGEELARNDQFFGSDSFLDFFVTTGGTYYIAVSSFGNSEFAAAIAGSGSTGDTSGTYNLRVSSQLQNDDVVVVNSTDPNLPRRVPFAENQTQGITSSTIAITDTREILDVNVRLTVNHTYTGDLVISLISPNGTSVNLVNRRGGTGDNFTNTLFDDEAGTSITTGVAPFSASFRPEVALGFFDGQRGNGTWTLVVNDTTALNSGFLTAWSLEFTFQNNIFGPFESNDTLTTARAITEFTGTGSATREAFLGDGGFGGFDRDIFSFTADAGTTLSAFVTAQGTFNSALRLFNAQGVEILLSNLTTTQNSQITNYVFTSGGIYYLAVSEGSNIAYNPAIAGSGVTAPTTGNYTLVINVAPGVSDPTTALLGDNVAVGVGTDGTIRDGSTNSPGAALVYNGIEFLQNNNNFLGLSANANSFTNNSAALQPELPFSLRDASDSFNQRLAASAVYRGLQIDRVFSFARTDRFIAVDIILTNRSGATLSNLAWMEGFNPDQGLNLAGNANTVNDVSPDGHFASASYITSTYQQGLTIALAAPAADPRAKTTFLSPATNVRDPFQIINPAILDPDGASADLQMAIAFNLGNLDANASTKMRYFIFFGDTPTDVDTMYDAVNDNTGTGHLTADAANPALETLQTGAGAPVNVPTLPYRSFYPEGFFNDNVYTFVPISNLSNQEAKVIVIARYETGIRDQVVGALTIPGNARSGLTLITPELFRAGGTLAGRPNAPYALEVRSDVPVAATFSHYDLNLIDGARAAIGESFTSLNSTTWSFASVSKGNNNIDFVLFYNPTNTVTKVTATFFPANGGASFSTTFATPGFDGLAPNRRGGISVNDLGIPDGVYGVTLSSEQPIVASLSHYNSAERNADGQVGNLGLGTTTGVIPQGEIGLAGTSETLGVLNSTTTATRVLFSFVFDNGSSYRTSLDVPAGQQRSLDVGSLPNFPSGRAYAVTYTSNNAATNAAVPVSFTSLTRAYGDAFATASVNQGYSLWGFGEGFRPGDVADPNHPGVVENLRVFNPSTTDAVIEITIGYDGINFVESFRRTVPAQGLASFNMEDFITGSRRDVNVFFSTQVKSTTPVVAYMSHFDRVFPGGFGTLGTPLGRVAGV